MRGRITERAVAALTAPSNTTDGYLWDDQIAGFGVRAKASGRKTFVFKYPHDGKDRWIAIGKTALFTPEEARLEARKHAGDIARGHNPVSRVALAEFAERFFTEGCPSKTSSTMRTHRGTFCNHIQPILGDRPVRSITEPEIARAITAITGGNTVADYRTGNLRGRARVHGGAGPAGKVARLLSMIFGFAQRCGLRRDNPAHAIAKRFPMYKQPDRRRTSLPADQPTEVLRVIERHFAEQRRRDEERRAEERQRNEALARKLTELGVDLRQQKEILNGVLRHQVGIAREVGAVEKPVAPRTNRRRPL
jgi:hypothetical protein